VAFVVKFPHFFDSFNGLRNWRWAGVDSAWEQKKLEATLREMFARSVPHAAKRQSPASGARFVGQPAGLQAPLPFERV